MDVEICTIQDQRAVGYPRTGAIDNHSLAPDKINNIDTDPRNTATNVVFGPVGTELAMSIGSVIGIELIQAMRVMLVHDRAIDQVTPALLANQYHVVGTCSPDVDLINEARRLRTDLIVLDMTTPSAQLLDQLRLMGEELPLPIIMFTDEADSGTIRRAIAAGVSAYIVDGLYVNRLGPVLNVALARFQEMQALRGELMSTRRNLKDRKRIDRAKGILMQRRGISEDAAYHSLRKLAMERNQKIGDVADSVILAADLLG